MRKVDLFVQMARSLRPASAMPVSGWVITLENDVQKRDSVLEALGRESRITCGEAHGLRLPVVAETSTMKEGESLFEALRAHDGVAFIDVVSIDFSDSLEDTREDSLEEAS